MRSRGSDRPCRCRSWVTAGDGNASIVGFGVNRVGKYLKTVRVFDSLPEGVRWSRWGGGAGRAVGLSDRKDLPAGFVQPDCDAHSF